MKEQLLSIASELIALLQSSVTFVKTELPILVQEILSYYTIRAWFTLGVCLLFTLTIPFGFRLLALKKRIENWNDEPNEAKRAKLKEAYYDDHEARALEGAIVIFVTSALAFLTMLFYAIPQVIMAHVAPRLFLIRILKDLF